jgi:hypothetical protein
VPGTPARMKLLLRYADNRAADSLAVRLRRRRFAPARALIDALPRPAKILDVGGTEAYWVSMGYLPPEDVRIVLLNLSAQETVHPGFSSVAGDARDMARFGDGEFDLVFSNSVIEHVGGYRDQERMAGEIMRVGRRFVVQTPNRSFIVEPHFLFPFFVWLPRRVKVFLLTHFSLGWYARCADARSAEAVIDSIRLLSKKELKNLFFGATIYRERFFGLTKSFVVVGPAGKKGLRLPGGRHPST